jgi:hypothetical protein
MVQLHAEAQVLSRFKILSKKDVKSSSALVDPNMPGSSTMKLSWIWQTVLSTEEKSSETLLECTCFLHFTFSDKSIIFMIIYLVQRVHWLHARVRRLRWQEEVVLVGYEMQWTVCYFLHNMQVWENRRDAGAGPAAYAARKSAMWHSMACNADHLFSTVNSSYITRLELN